MKTSLSAIILATLSSRVAAGNFLFLNFEGWYENFDSYNDYHRSLKKDKDKGNKAAALSKSDPGSIDPFASFVCTEDKRFKTNKCDVVLVAYNNEHCFDTNPDYPTALAKGSFYDWQWDKSSGVTKAINFDIECCGADGCEPDSRSTGKYVFQQLPDGHNKNVPGLRVYGPVADADDKEPVADGEWTVVIRTGGGLKKYW